MMGGWMMGTIAMYEYAEMAIGPSSASSARRIDTKMAVGPSAPPMMPMAPAFSSVNPSADGPQERPENANLRRGPKQRHCGPLNKGSEVCERSEAQEHEQREELCAEPGTFEQHEKALALAQAAEGHVGQHDAHADGDEQQRLEALVDGQEDEPQRNEDHHAVLPEGRNLTEEIAVEGDFAG